MKNVSTALKNVLKKDNVVERDYIILSETTNRIYLWFKFYDDCYKDGNFVQNFIMKRIEFDYADNDIDFKKKEFKAYKEYKLEDGTWESICYGSFIVTDTPESDTKESVKVTAYDYALKFANNYVTDLNYASGNVTLFDVLKECCTKCGVQTDITSFANFNFIVDSNQFSNTDQFGNVISAVAGASCSFAKIINDKLCLIFTNETDVVINVSDYEEFDDKRDTHPYTIVGLGVSNIEGENVTMRWEEGIEQYGENYLMINDNPFAYTQAKRQQLIIAIYNKSKGFGYSAMTLKNCLYPFLEPGDVITVKNKAGESVKTIVFRTTFEDVQCTIESPSITNATVTYENPVTALNIAKNTQIVVNKQNQIIASVVEEQSSQSSKISQVQQDVNGVSTTVQQVGGLNLIQDSTLRLGFSGNVKTGTVSIEQYASISDNTLSKSAIKINNGSVKFASVKIQENVDHTFSCKINKLDLTNVSVKITSDKEEIYNISCEPEKFNEFEFKINSSIGTITIEIISDNNYALFSDCMLNKGEKLSYQPYAGEVIGENYQFGNGGLQITSTSTNSKLTADSEQIKITNTENGNTVAAFNGDNTELVRAIVQDRLGIGKVRISSTDNGHAIFTHVSSN